MPEGSDHSRLGDAFTELGRLTVEQLRCHRIDADLRRVVGIAAEQLANAGERTSDEVWFDIQASNPDDFQALLNQLDLHPLVLEDCLDPHRSSRFSSYESSLHFEVPVFSIDAIDDYLSVICVPRLLITSLSLAEAFSRSRILSTLAELSTNFWRVN